MVLRLITAVGTVCAVVAVLAMAWRASAADNPDPQAQIKRGDYLVNQVAHCGNCHTPRDAKGNLDPARHLQGAPIWFTPKSRPEEWEDKAPDITANGTAGEWSEAKMVKFFTTGKGADAPMPAYKLADEDARAVTAYLRSLPGNGKGGRKAHGD